MQRQRSQRYGVILDWADRFMIPLLFVVAIAAGWQMHRGWKIGKILLSDAEGYYVYLPATLIYGSWGKFDGQDGLSAINCCLQDSNGLVTTRYTYGVALMEAPFFGVAHALASSRTGSGTAPPANWGNTADPEWLPELNLRRYTPLRGQATGFSEMYAFAVLVGAAFYMALGLWYLKRALRRSFRTEVAIAATALVFLATNLFYYTAGESGMSHVHSFCLFAIMLYHVPEWLRVPTWRRGLLIGIVFGLVVLIRPTNVLLGLLFLGWEVYSWESLGARLKFLWKHRGICGTMIVAALIVMVPQLIHWKQAYGTWFAWSYGDEGFSNWMSPKVLKVLFSYQNGLFLYTPIMLLAMAGLVIAWRRRSTSAPMVGLMFALATYAFASWWAWWFGGAFGHRCYVEWYVFLALPLAVVVQQIAISKTRWPKMLGIVVAIVLVYANVKMSMMYGGLWDGPDWTWDRYLDVWAGVAKLSWWPGF